MAAMITFAAPALLWGALTAVAPVVIHLVMRQKARHVLFPAMRLLARKMAAGRQAQRLRYLLLLLSRIAIILLIAVLLMEGRCQPDRIAGAASRAAGEPVSAVICLDDSASMGYRFQGRTRLEAARDLARTLIEDHARFGPGCEFAVISSAGEEPGNEGPARRSGMTDLWTADRGRAAQALRQISPAWHGHGAGTLLQRAYRQLAQARNTRREVYLITDLAEHAWREPLPPPPKDLASVCILDAGHQENLNVTMAWPATGEHVLPEGVTNLILCRLRTADAPAEAFLELTLDGRPQSRQTVEPIAADTERDVPLTLPPLEQGTHTLAIELKPDDALPADNRRFACIRVGDLPRVAILADRPDNEVAAMISAMIAPAALTSIEKRYAVDTLKSQGPGAGRLEGCVAAVLADAAATSTDAWDALTRYVESGGTLILVPGRNTTLAGLAAAAPLLPAPVEDIIRRDPPVNVAATEFGHPHLRPFADTGIDSINDRPVFRTLRLGLVAAGAQVLAPFSDGSPAILTRSVGKGRVIQLAFSPDRDWSLFGSQAAPMIVLLQNMLADLTPRSELVASFSVGETVRRWLDGSAGPLSIVYPGDSQPRAIRLQSAQLELPTGLPGTYRVQSNPDNPQPLLDYAVNVPETESDMTRATTAAITARFPPGVATVAGDVEILAGGKSGQATVRWTVPVALILLTLLIAESLFANRFYGYREPASRRQ